MALRSRRRGRSYGRRSVGGRGVARRQWHYGSASTSAGRSPMRSRSMRRPGCWRERSRSRLPTMRRTASRPASSRRTAPVARMGALDPAQIAFIAHSTTQATNAMLEGDVADVAVIGFARGVGGAFARSQMRFPPIALSAQARFAPLRVRARRLGRVRRDRRAGRRGGHRLRGQRRVRGRRSARRGTRCRLCARTDAGRDERARGLRNVRLARPHAHRGDQRGDLAAHAPDGPHDGLGSGGRRHTAPLMIMRSDGGG